MKRYIPMLASIAMLAGCVTDSGIQPDGPDAYRIMRVGKTGFSSSGKMQLNDYKQASAFCGQKGLVVQTIDTESKQARPLGGWPEATLRFKCVLRDKNS